MMWDGAVVRGVKVGLLALPFVRVPFSRNANAFKTTFSIIS